MQAEAAVTGARSEGREGVRDWPWVAVILGYFVFQVAWRRLVGGGLSLDEAQMFLWGREPLALGYGPQPPLYSWLQWAAFRLIPDPLLALAVVKNALLAGTYLTVLAVLRLVHPAQVAGLGAACLMLMPQVAWDSQREMTHSVLVVTLAAVMVLVLWTRALPGRRGGWLVFGLVVGLGLLSKVNFAVAAAALVLAAASVPEVRARMQLRGLAVAAVAAALVVAGPAGWAVVHRGEALSSVEELKAVGGLLAGLAAVASALVACWALAGVVLGSVGAVWREPRPAGPVGVLERLLWRAVAIGVGLVCIGVVATGTTHVRDMWILPVVFWAVPLAAVRVQGRLSVRGVVVLRRVVVGLAVLVATAVAVHMRYGDPGHPTIQRAPVAAVAEALVARFPQATRIVADPDWLAGNLIYQRPDLPVLASRRPGAAPAPGETVVLVWWTPDRRAVDRRNAMLAGQWGAVPVVLGEAVALEAPFPPQPAEIFRVDAAVVTMPAGTAGP